MVIEREWVGARASMVLTFLVGALSVATGIANITVTIDAPDFVLFGITLPGYVQQITAFTGTLTGFLLLVTAFGLRRRLRVGWYATMVLFPVTVAQGALQSTEQSIPLIGLSTIAFVVVGLNFRAFDRELQLTTTQVAALTALAGAQAYGTVGAFALRDPHFDGIHNLLDAFYFSLVTGSTVGYGDITPAPTSAVGELFTLSVILVTVSSFAAVLGVVFTPLIEAQLSKALGRMTEEQLDLLENHVLVLGHGDLTEPILEELTQKTDVLILTPDEERTRRLTDRGYTVLTADPSDEDSQIRGRVKSAQAVVTATNNDAEDALAILTARQLNPEVTIVAAATHRENVNKLKRAGADTVISPAALGAHFLAESALGGEGVEELAQRLMAEEPSQDGDAQDVLRDEDDA
ncbi:kef-type k+ ransport system, NAD-binding component [Halogeometricum borinquense DSM 11551]|uniref:Kef-type K+ ransport system, predicted NAD-binding component n=2 Tax=Halogeometricum borinquense TaxID=60847 RepID=E4NPS2_HALBP|nr:NAD-binding protein [Halogeometricum borinquense]ADQ66555.1 Kef-type K+ ransport system, predicted NAD-binding component [Halogeometricum borinquense DSM 11551]ELY30663.1 kef-type k+ ransport system, NAD-binding component [Halogeometricum borinquense DSM 11551]RYJ14416.1 potassium channel protein [Halogeometricum borinquense]